MRKPTGSYPKLAIDTTGKRVVSHGGAAVLLQLIGKAGLDRALSVALEPWRKPLAKHGPAKVVLDLAVSLAIGGDCLADIAQLRAEPGCSVRSRRTRPSHESSTRSQRMPQRCSPRSVVPAGRCGNGCGSRPGNRPRTSRSTLTGR